MTSTPVKDVGSVLNSLAAGSGSRTQAGEGFQKVLNGQSGKETAGSATEGSKTAVKKAPGESLKAKDDHLARMERQSAADAGKTDADRPEEIPEEKLEQVMEVLGTAAAEMMQQIADVFGVSVEEVQSTMQELGMNPSDVLDQSKLGELLLQLGGAENSYALVTDGELYGQYRELMTQLEEVLNEAGEELEMAPEQLAEAVQKMPEISVREMPEEISDETADHMQMQTDAPEEPAAANAADGPAVQTAETKAFDGNTEGGAESGQKQDSADRGEHSHLTAQDIRLDQFQGRFTPEIQQAPEPEVWSTDTQDIMRQIMDYMRIQVKPEMSNLEMQLHPESLGTLQIHIASKGGVVTANFIAQNDAVKAALESQMVQLRENFEQQGVKVEAIEVTVQAHAFERNLDQGRGQSGGQEEPARRPRTRRINLNEPLEPESLEEEDTLAAEMMAANGGQVDYMA